MKQVVAWLLGASLLLTMPISIAGHAGAESTPYAELRAGEVDQSFAHAPAQPLLAPVDRRAVRAPARHFAPLRSAALKSGQVRVIVGLRTQFQAEGLMSATSALQQRATIRSAADRVTAALSGTEFRVMTRFELTPAIALELGPAGLSKLERSGEAASIQIDALSRPTLAESTVVVEATEAASLGRTGAGQTIAILDTGVDSKHPFLQQAAGKSKVVGEACFSAEADCPGRTAVATRQGSGAPCTYSEICGHGTHVAGIAAGRGGPGSGTTMNGVARDATLYSINVYSDLPGCSPCSYTSDQIKALEHVFQLRQRWSFAAVNLSLGGGLSTTACDEDIRKLAIDNLRSVGIPTIIASGNNGFRNGVSFPACISSAITVASTTESDEISDFSNSSPLVDLLAPGSNITSSYSGHGYETFEGTSLAAPHVAGAWAVVQAATPGPSPVAVIEEALESTGKSVTDPDHRVSTPRIRVLAASARLKDTGFRTSFQATEPGLDLVSNGVGLATRAGGPRSGLISITGMPARAAIRKTYLYWATEGGPDSSVVFQGSTVRGELIGAGAGTCSRRSTTRVYRAPLASTLVAGNRKYALSGVGGAPGVDGTGASLVVVYRRPTSNSVYGTSASSSAYGASPSRLRHVTIRDGALTANRPGERMSDILTGLDVSRTPSDIRLHVGLGNGQLRLAESPMTFRGWSVSPPSAFRGSDGPMWDDLTLAVPPPALPAGTVTATNAITVTSDCLSWAYSALSYSYGSTQY